MKYVIANWKQNKTLSDALAWSSEFVQLVKETDLSKVTPVICPPTPFLEEMHKMLGQYGIELGVQDISPYTDGAHTGFVGAKQIVQFCKYAIIGHSERQESRDLVMQKAGMCLENSIKPVVCFKSDNEYAVVAGAIYALEDPQNISVNEEYRPKNLQDVVNLIDKARKFFGTESSIIYGGSVNVGNVNDLSSISNLDGVLVGNASLNPEEFADIVRKFSL